VDPREIELIQRLAATHEELRALWKRHRSLEEELQSLDGQRFLTPQEAMRRKEIQKAKLAGRDRIQAILEQHR
jgi:uncharacterized protein YdcH (DUF465 family)